MATDEPDSDLVSRGLEQLRTQEEEAVKHSPSYIKRWRWYAHGPSSSRPPLARRAAAIADKRLVRSCRGTRSCRYSATGCEKTLRGPLSSQQELASSYM